MLYTPLLCFYSVLNVKLGRTNACSAIVCEYVSIETGALKPSIVLLTTVFTASIHFRTLKYICKRHKGDNIIHKDFALSFYYTEYVTIQSM